MPPYRSTVTFIFAGLRWARCVGIWYLVALPSAPLVISIGVFAPSCFRAPKVAECVVYVLGGGPLDVLWGPPLIGGGENDNGNGWGGYVPIVALLLGIGLAVWSAMVWRRHAARLAAMPLIDVEDQQHE